MLCHRQQTAPSLLAAVGHVDSEEDGYAVQVGDWAALAMQAVELHEGAGAWQTLMSKVRWWWWRCCCEVLASNVVCIRLLWHLPRSVDRRSCVRVVPSVCL